MVFPHSAQYKAGILILECYRIIWKQPTKEIIVNIVKLVDYI